MSRLIRFLLIAVVLSLLAASVLPAMAQANVETCPAGRPRFQVRFYDFPDIPVFFTESDADRASAIFSGEIIADQIPAPAFRIRGGPRQKYLLCGAFSVGDGSARIVAMGRNVWAPEYLIESIVPREWRDNQAGTLGDFS